MRLVSSAVIWSILTISTTFAVPGRGLPIADPETVGLSSERLERLNGVMRSYVEQKKLAGIITAIARRGKLAHFECHGVMDLESKRPMTPDAIFRIYSMTKPIASVAVMMLYEEGLFQLDDPVAKYIPEFDDIKVAMDGSTPADPERPVTIRHLLTHTSALNYDYPESTPYRADYIAFQMGKYSGNLHDMVRKLTKLPLSHQPGTRWQYSTLSTDVLGYLVEVLSGMTFDYFLEERLFKPLGMTDTGFHVPPEKIGRFTTTYGPDGEGGIKAVDSPSTSRYTTGPASYFSGGGGLVSTADDYLRFAQMMLDGGSLDGARILGRKTVELMTANHLPDTMIPYGFNSPELEYVCRGFGFGLGLAVLMDPAEYGHPGSAGLYRWAGAANTDFWVDPQEELIGLILTQFRPNGFYPVDRQFKVLTYQALQ